MYFKLIKAEEGVESNTVLKCPNCDAVLSVAFNEEVVGTEVPVEFEEKHDCPICGYGIELKFKADGEEPTATQTEDEVPTTKGGYDLGLGGLKFPEDTDIVVGFDYKRTLYLYIVNFNKVVGYELLNKLNENRQLDARLSDGYIAITVGELYDPKSVAGVLVKLLERDYKVELAQVRKEWDGITLAPIDEF